MGSTAPLNASGAAGRVFARPVDTNETSSPGETASSAPPMRRGDTVLSYLTREVGSKKPITRLGGASNQEASGGHAPAKTRGDAIDTLESKGSEARVRRAKEPARADPLDDGPKNQPKEAPKRLGLLGALKSFRGVMQGAGTLLGGGAAAVGGANAISLWLQTKMLNTLPMLGWAGLAVGGAVVGGVALSKLIKRARTPVAPDGAGTADGTDGSKGTDGPSKGDPRNGDLPKEPPKDIPRDNDRRPGGRGLSNAGKVISTIAGTAALGALGLAVKAAFASAGLALPPVAAGIGVAVGIGLVGMTVSRLFGGRKK